MLSWVVILGMLARALECILNAIGIHSGMEYLQTL